MVQDDVDEQESGQQDHRDHVVDDVAKTIKMTKVSDKMKSTYWPHTPQRDGAACQEQDDPRGWAEYG